MKKEQIIGALVEVAQRAAQESTNDHPEDLGYVMSAAIENAAVTMKVLMEQGSL